MSLRSHKNWIAAALLALGTSACGHMNGLLHPQPQTAEEIAREREREREEARADAMAEIPASPAEAQPRRAASLAIWKSALAANGTRVVVSTSDRALWVLQDTAVALRAPIAVGMHEPFEYGGRIYDFSTPIGKRRVIAKATDPVWTPPDWHYFEKAVDEKLELVRLKMNSRYELADGTTIEVRGKDVGRVNAYGNFWPFTPGGEIIFDGKIFVPPIGTNQRRLTEILGTHKLELGDGYMIHGTNEESSIGEAVSHGCVRMYNEDVARVYAMVPKGAAVFIY